MFELLLYSKILLVFQASCFLISLITVPTVEARQVNHTWVVSYQYKYLDCYKKLSIAINGTTPGPTLDAVEGDTITITVVNNLLMENVAIHWHGIRQFGTQWSDGTDSVTQCSTMPGDTFTYQFVVDRAGTFMYHSHYGMQRAAGLYGLIRVAPAPGKKDPFSYNGDIGIVLSDWYHTSPYEQATDLASVPFVWIGEPQSLLINGRGKYNCTGLSSDICNATNPQCSPTIFSVKQGDTYRLRIASLTSLSALSFQIENHNMTIVEADGSYVEPIEVENLYIYSGETYSVLVTANNPNGIMNNWISINVVSRQPQTPIGLAILNYNSTPPTQPTSPPPPGPLWNDTNARVNQSRSIKARKGYIVPPPDPYKTIILLNTQNTIDGRIRWSLNNVSHDLPHTPYLIGLKENWNDTFDQTPPPENYDTSYNIFGVANNTNATISTSIYRLTFNKTVDVVLQNANTMTEGYSETHPWHLHGHDFWVLHYGDGQFNLSTDVSNYNLTNPIRKNTVPLHPYGWTALRFTSDNPGIWLFHCHIEAHFYLGMLVLFESGSEMVSNPPHANMGCGKTKDLFSP